MEKPIGPVEVLGLNMDRDLIRSLAKKLSRDDLDASRIRAKVKQTVSGQPKKGGIFAALRRSPLVGADLKIVRSVDAGRDVDL